VFRGQVPRSLSGSIKLRIVARLISQRLVADYAFRTGARWGDFRFSSFIASRGGVGLCGMEGRGCAIECETASPETSRSEAGRLFDNNRFSGSR